MFVRFPNANRTLSANHRHDTLDRVPNRRLTTQGPGVCLIRGFRSLFGTSIVKVKVKVEIINS